MNERWLGGVRGLSLAAGGIVVVVLVLMGAASAGAVVRPMTPGAAPSVLPTCGVGSFPTGVTYNPVNHDLYVANQASRNITILGPGCAVVKSITLPKGANPQFGAFNPSNNDVYVTDFALNQVYVIQGMTKVATLGGGHFNAPAGITYDPGVTGLFVANFGWSNITEVTGTFVGHAIPVGSEPQDIAYDPEIHTLLISCFGSNNVTIIDSSFPFSSTHLSAPAAAPIGILFNPEDHFDYVADYGSNNVTVMTGLGAIAQVIPVAHGPIWLGFSQAKLHVYVTMQNSNSVWIISGTSVVKKVFLGKGTGPIGLAYDDFDNQMYIAAATANELVVLA